MDVFELLIIALELLGLGMAFVFLFLGLLMVAVNLIAKYLPPDAIVPVKKKAQASRVTPPSDSSAINPKIVTAITAAVHQYHKTKTAQ
ncbi:MAG: OadG family transporter subunit [Psychromonas sp.]